MRYLGLFGGWGWAMSGARLVDRLWPIDATLAVLGGLACVLAAVDCVRLFLRGPEKEGAR